MKLCYRGVFYEYTPTIVEMVEGEVAGKYRGANWKYQVLKQTPLPQTMLRLKYRGVTNYVAKCFF